MARLMKLALTLCLVTIVIMDVCDAQTKRKAKKSRSRNNRRCPSTCLRKIREIEQYGKRPGPQGPQGLRGPPGPQGPPLILPVCKPGEFLTSDGQNLLCQKLDLSGVCDSLSKGCSSSLNDKDATTGNKGTVNRNRDRNTTGRMVKFMKKNMFQSISTDAWDIEVFRIDGALYFGLSQLGQASFQIYKWYSNSFKSYQTLPVSGARNWAPFKIGNDQYFVVGNFLGTTCPIFRYDRSENIFRKQTFGIDCKQAVDLKAFKLNGVQHIVVPNHEDGQSVVLWKWNGKRFIKRQNINITATYVEMFDVNGVAFLAISGTNKGPNVFLYKWDGRQFTLTQQVFTGLRPYHVTALVAGQDEFICIATKGISLKGINTSLLHLMKWNGNEFQSFQNITSYEARRVTAISGLMGKQTAYLAVINFSQRPEIYYWVGGSSSRFERLQEIEAKSARDVCFFEMGRNVYMLMASRKHIEIFRGEMV